MNNTCIDVIIINDHKPKKNRDFVVMLSISAPNYQPPIDNDKTIVTIIDNDRESIV